MEVSFSKEIELLRLGQGQTFHGEGILAITKALLQSGVAYVGGYQGAPVSHLLDVMVQAKPYMDELGVHVEACANEASAAALLGASINYPMRGAVTWKSIVGTNVASDARSNLSSPGVTGGALSQGAPADISVLAPDLAVSVRAAAQKSLSKNMPFEGWKLRGGVAATIVGGRLVYRNTAVAGLDSWPSANVQ